MNIKKYIGLIFCFCFSFSYGVFSESKIVNCCMFLEDSSMSKSFVLGKHYGRQGLDVIFKSVLHAIKNDVEVIITSPSFAYVLGVVLKDIDTIEVKRKQRLGELQKEYERTKDKKLLHRSVAIEFFMNELPLIKSCIDKLKKGGYILNKIANSQENARFAFLVKKDAFHKITFAKPNSIAYKIEYNIGWQKAADHFKMKDQDPVDEQVLRVFLDMIPNRKFLYLEGHGYYDYKYKKLSKMAGLSFKQYSSFIDNVKKCLFLFVSSCYAGGWNAIMMHAKGVISGNKLILKKRDLKFPIAVGTLPDRPSRGFSTNFKVFFNGLQYVFADVRDVAKMGWTKRSFEKIFKSVYGNKLVNFPSIRFPGIDTFWSAVQVDKDVEIITNAYLVRHELRNRFKLARKEAKELKKDAKESKEEEKLEELEKMMRKVQVVSIKKKTGKKIIRQEMLPPLKFIKGIKFEDVSPIKIHNKKAILLYPSIINIPIEISGKMPEIISMIAGAAHHFLKKIIMKNLMFKYEFLPDDENLPPKMFLIEDIVSVKGNQGGRLASFYSIFDHVFKSSVKMSVAKKHDGTWVKMVKGKTSSLRMNKAFEFIQRGLKRTTPDRKAQTLFEATGGTETEAIFQKIVNESLFPEFGKNVFSTKGKVGPSTTTGIVQTKSGEEFQVLDQGKLISCKVLHAGKVDPSRIAIGDKVRIKIFPKYPSKGWIMDVLLMGAVMKKDGNNLTLSRKDKKDIMLDISPTEVEKKKKIKVGSRVYVWFYPSEKSIGTVFAVFND